MKARTAIWCGRSVVGALCLTASTFAVAQKYTFTIKEAEERLGMVARVVARISDVWVKDERYREFHKSLASDFGDTPPLQEFMERDQWFAGITSRGQLSAGIYKGFGATALNLQVGDIVEMNVRHRYGPTKAKAYSELNQVTKVLCKAGSPDYAQCADVNPLKWFDASGQVVQQFP